MNDYTEAAWQADVIRLAKMHHWMVFHPRKMQDRNGEWRTSLSGDAGFPDLVLVSKRRQGVIFAELKSAKGRLDEKQIDWLRTIDYNGAECYVWRPNDLKFVVERLSRK